MLILNRRSAAGALALILLAGCKDALGPGSVDVASLSADVATMTAAFTNSASLQDMAALSQFFPAFPTAAGVRAPSGVPLSSQAFRARVAAERSLARLLSASPQALFPPTVLGKTLAWDTVSHTYKIDNTLTGAPTNGIRILMYSANFATGEPLLPLSQTGYLELTDQSAAQASTLGVRLTQGATTVIDYAITFATFAVASDTLASLKSVGFINDPAGPGRVDFVFDDTLGLKLVVFAGQLTASDGSHIQAGVRQDTTSIGVFVLVSKGGNSITLDLLATSVVSGLVKFNGVSVATISGDLATPTFTGANGHTLTSQQSSGLLEIFGGAVLVIGELTVLVITPGLIVFH